MNLIAKKIYCYDCKKLVYCRLEKDKDSKIEYVACRKCNKRLQEKGVAAWRDLRKKKIETFSESILSPLMITELDKMASKDKKKKKNNDA